MDFITQQFVEFGSAGILLALFFGTFVSEDLACISAGSLAASGMIDPFSAVAACFAGIVVGDVMLFAAGRLFGAQIVDSRLGSRFISRQSLDRASAWMSKKGTSAIFISRFVSGLRLPTYFLSGMLRLDSKRFVFFVAIAAAIWTPAVIAVAALWHMTVPFGAIVGLIAAFVSIKLLFPLTDWKLRRIFLGKLKRIWKWEFWPLWLFYSPVVVYVFYLAIRFRGLHFTAANPGMPAGGFVGESKDAIYKLIASSGSAGPRLPRYVRLETSSGHSDLVHKAMNFIAQNELSYPIVVKPDAGERGNCVVVVRSKGELHEALLQTRGNVLVQEYVAGVEASIFYYRQHREEHGRIFSITEKIFPTLVGDGTSTLEDLILRDTRAHIAAQNYFNRNASRLQTVPEVGERIQLVDIGAHSKGAIFREGGWLRSEELEDAVDSLSSKIPGFYFGRYDVRSESVEKLRKGSFKIIELNGVTSESTNIYDPRYSLIDAYRILFAQWRIAFEIGRQNAERGSSRTSASDLVRLIVSRKQTN